MNGASAIYCASMLAPTAELEIEGSVIKPMSPQEQSGMQVVPHLPSVVAQGFSYE